MRVIHQQSFALSFMFVVCAKYCTSYLMALMCNTSAVRGVVQNLVSCSSSHALHCATTFLSLTSAIGNVNIVNIITITNITISITILTTSKMNNIRCLCDINDPSLSVLKLLKVARDLTAGNFLIEKLPNCPPPPPATPQF